MEPEKPVIAVGGRHGSQPTTDLRFGLVRTDAQRRRSPRSLRKLSASSPYWRAKWERQWAETKPETLSRKIPAILRELEAEASTIARLVEEAEREAELQRQRWEVERIEHERRALEHAESRPSKRAVGSYSQSSRIGARQSA
jgi:hypothetical protein